MYLLRDLQKACKKSMKGKELHIAVLGNCATQFFSQAVEGYSKLSNLNLCVYDVGYDQMDEQLLDPLSEVYDFRECKVVKNGAYLAAMGCAVC